MRVSLSALNEVIQRLGWSDGLLALIYRIFRKRTLIFHYQSRSVWYTVPFGINWMYLEKGSWQESTTVRFLSEIVRKGDTILDIGACQGEYTLLLSDLVGEVGRVVAFEPDPVAFAKLTDNVGRNGLRNVTCERLAVSNSIGVASLASEELGGSSSSLVRFEGRDNAGKTRVLVPTTTIDQYCTDRGVRPTGLKIDVEGAEGLLFEGMQETIRSSPWIVLEFHSLFMREDVRVNVWNTITQNAKEVTYIEGPGSLIPSGSSLRTTPHGGKAMAELPRLPSFRVFIRY